MKSADYSYGGFKQFLRTQQQNRDDNELFPTKGALKVRNRLDEIGVDPESGRGALASVAAVTAGFSADAAERAVGDGQNDLGLQDDFSVFESADLSSVVDAAESHPHRRGWHRRVNKALMSLDNLTVDSASVSSMEDALAAIERQDDPFATAIDCFLSLSTVGPVSSFDIVDFLVRANGREQLVPDDVKTTRLPSALPNSPSKTLERVTDGANGSFIELVQFAKTELGVSQTAAVFDLESCLCVYDGNPRATAGCECSGSCGCDTRGSEVC
jgi:hypothetical protein